MDNQEKEQRLTEVKLNEGEEEKNEGDDSKGKNDEKESQE